MTLVAASPAFHVPLSLSFLQLFSIPLHSEIVIDDTVFALKDTGDSMASDCSSSVGLLGMLFLHYFVVREFNNNAY